MFPEIPPEIPLTLRELVSKTRVRVLFLWRKVLPPPDLETRAEVQLALRDQSEPDYDYFVMVLLSCTIPTFGLLIDSAATIIGAMLVAPLMSPILGLGLASIRGDTLLLRNAATALARGAVLAILLSAIITWVNSQLPFIGLQFSKRKSHLCTNFMLKNTYWHCNCYSWKAKFLYFANKTLTKYLCPRKSPNAII